jgi:hypothetical protein
MAHPRIASFFTGAVDELLAAYRKSEGSAAANKGSLREEAVKRAIMHSLPATARLYDGEIVDPFGGQSGQLDGIVVAATGAALATSPTDPRVVLAEAALGVIESKSDIGAQWDEVKLTWNKLRVLRRYKGNPAGAWHGGGPHPSDHAFPLLIVGRFGWQKNTTLRDKAKELFDAFGDGYPPPVLVAQLEPPGLGFVVWQNNNNWFNDGVMFPPEERWRVLGTPWYTFAERAQRCVSMPVNWAAYLG